MNRIKRTRAAATTTTPGTSPAESMTPTTSPLWWLLLRLQISHSLDYFPAPLLPTTFILTPAREQARTIPPQDIVLARTKHHHRLSVLPHLPNFRLSGPREHRSQKGSAFNSLCRKSFPTWLAMQTMCQWECRRYEHFTLCRKVECYLKVHLL